MNYTDIFICILSGFIGFTVSYIIGRASFKKKKKKLDPGIEYTKAYIKQVGRELKTMYKQLKGRG